MDKSRVLVLHDVDDKVVDVGEDVQVDGLVRGRWRIRISISNEKNHEVYYKGVFEIPQVAKSVMIDFRSRTVSWCETAAYAEGRTHEISWIKAKVA